MSLHCGIDTCAFERSGGFRFMHSVPPDLIRSISIETSGPIASVALGLGDRLVAEESFAATVGHAGSLLLSAEELCGKMGWRPADLHECYVSIGPGSFTGLRVAVTFARHLALAARVRLVAVPTLQAIAWNLIDESNDSERNVSVFVEAKKGMVFAASFAIDGKNVRSIDAPEMVAPDDYLARAPRPLVVAGRGVAPFIDLVCTRGADVAPESTWPPLARGIFALGRLKSQSGAFTHPAELVPLYVRRPEAEELWEKRQASTPQVP